MNRSQNPSAIAILELMIQNPYKMPIPLLEFYEVIKRFYGFDLAEFNKAIGELQEEDMVEFCYHNAGNSLVIGVTQKGMELATLLFPRFLYKI